MTACRHRWEPSEFGKRYWAPGTYQHRCARCGEMRMVVLQSRQEEEGECDAGALAKDLPGGTTDAAT